MNCFNHYQNPAVAQCSNCGKGLCPECIERCNPTLCNSCFLVRKRHEIWRSIINLILLIILFFIGFKWNIISNDNPSIRLKILSGYMLMAIWAGYLFTEQFTPRRTIIIKNQKSIIIEYTLKFIFCSFIGQFIAPFTVLWAIYRVFRAFK